MTPDVVDLRNFYASPLGQAACRSLTRAISARWSKLTGLHVMGLGYGVPYLDAFLGKAERVIAAMPEKQGVIHWPPHSPSATVLVVNTLLPFADQSLDRVLLVHSIETEESPADLLDEVWRVLSPGGSVLVVRHRAALHRGPAAQPVSAAGHPDHALDARRGPRARVELARDSAGKVASSRAAAARGRLGFRRICPWHYIAARAFRLHDSF